MAVSSSVQRHTGARRIAVFGLPIVVLAAVVWGIAVFFERPSTTVARDADLCPVTDAVSGHTVFLLDLRKPLSESGRASIGEALRQVASGLVANAELRVFVLSGTDAAPRRQIDRLCRPYDESTLASHGASAHGEDACADLPADLPEHEAAVQFCARRDALEQRIDSLAAPAGAVANAFLVEAIEETSLEFADLPGPKSLVVFSDMVQHAPWHSQAEGAATVGFAEFDRLRAQQNARIGPPPPAPQNVDVTIFYLPRMGMTEDAQRRRGHRRFWQEYVMDAFHTAPVFNELPAMPAYEVVSFDRQSPDELAAAERLQQEREEAERLLEQVVRERAALEQAQRAVEASAPVAAQAGLALEQASDGLAEAAEERVLASADEASSQAAAEAATDPQTASGEPDAPPSDVIAEFDAGDEPPQAAAAEQIASAEQVASAEQIASAEPEAVEPPAATQPTAPPPPLPEDLASLDAAPSSAPCPVQLKPRFEGVLPEPPRLPSRAAERLATATIAVRYVVDEQGATVDNEVAIVESQSTVNPPAFLPQFSASARELVEEWEFDFMPTADANCTRQQELTVRFRFGG